MNMLMKIFFKCFQRLIECVVADTSVRRNFVIRGRAAKLAQYFTRRVVFHHHHAHGIVDRAERRKWRGPMLRLRLIETEYVWEKYLLFFEHVRLKISAQCVKQRADFIQLGMVLAMRGNYFLN